MRTHLQFLTLLLALVLTGCLKVPVEPEALNTNPVDPDYTGESFFTLGEGSLEWDDTNFHLDLVFDITVDTERFNLLSSYFVLGKNEAGEILVKSLAPAWSSNNSVVQARIDNVSGGATYCLDYSLEIAGGETRAYNHCITAP